MIPIGGDYYIRAYGIRDVSDDSVPSSFDTKEAKILDSNESTVSNSTVTMTSVSGRDDELDVTVPDTATSNLTDGTEYTTQVTLQVANNGPKIILQVKDTAGYPS